MIEEYKYGMFRVDGKMHQDDLILIKDRVRFWECDEQKIDKIHIEPILQAQPDFLIVGLGAGGLVSLTERAKEALRFNRIPFVEKKNPEACTLYNNALKEGRNIAAILPVRG